MTATKKTALLLALLTIGTTLASCGETSGANETKETLPAGEGRGIMYPKRAPVKGALPFLYPCVTITPLIISSPKFPLFLVFDLSVILR